MGCMVVKKYIGLEEMSNGNCASVLNIIRHCGEISRKEISDISGLSWGGMTKIVNKLFEKGYIVEDKSEKTGGQGRTPHVIRMNRGRNFVIGLDINRMGFGAYVMNLAGEVIKEYSEEGSFDNRNNLLKAMITFTKKIFEEYASHNILAVGVAMQGLLDVENGISIQFPRCADWKNVPIKHLLQKEFQVDVFVEHDPNCMLYSAIRELENENMLLLRIDSSIGMAASVGGKILRGNGLLEVAHHIVIPDGKLCRCGQKGCLEAYIAPCFVNKQLQPSAVADMITPLAVFMNNMCKIFHSKEVILTGKLIEHKTFFEKVLLNKFYQNCEKEEVSVRFVEEAGKAVHGAALIAVQGAIDQIRI